jgi:hypothetical protein
MERLDNWMSYNFDNIPNKKNKESRVDIFKLHLSKNIKVKNLSYIDALYYNAKMIAENYSQPFDVLLSGGIDSEIVVRVFKELGIVQNVYTFQFENNHNIQDVSNARKICNTLGIKLNLISFKLQHWIENDAYSMYQKTFHPSLHRMIRFAWFDYLDNIIVTGEGEPYWKRDLLNNYTCKSKWKLHWIENYFSSSLYANLIGRTVIGEWYNYTPEIVASFHKLPLIQKLLNDEIPGKISCWSNRIEVHRAYWPDIFDKSKLIGYEGNQDPGYTPEFMVKFYNEVMKGTSDYGYSFSQEDMDSLFQNKVDM